MRVGIFLVVLTFMAGTVRAGEVGNPQQEQRTWRQLEREWLGTSQEVKGREAALVLASKELHQVAEKIKVVPESPEMDQLVIDSATRHAEAMVAVEQAREALSRAESQLWGFYLQHVGEQMKSRLIGERMMWEIEVLRPTAGTLGVFVPPVVWLELG